ncbi:hypothetical protein TrST_g2463 [Triparma strigata]|uniref:Ras-GEF domain-containing protein n=1 Tax=Triparma strigata TaxID=1606541 RepID=A0A9W7BNA8_9STRA|nr:hypothetical protein TrST_g2463 [Triparma strigata]
MAEIVDFSKPATANNDLAIGSSRSHSFRSTESPARSNSLRRRSSNESTASIFHEHTDQEFDVRSSMAPESIYGDVEEMQVLDKDHEDERLGEHPISRQKALSMPEPVARKVTVAKSSGSLAEPLQEEIYKSAPAAIPEPNVIKNENGDKFDVREGLLYRRPSYEAEGQNELSKSRHRLRGATLPALLRRLTSLEVSTKDDCWSFLCRSRALLSPVHFLGFVAARFFLDTYRPNSRCHPYNILKKHKKEVDHRSKKREFLHMINIHPKSKAPKSSSGEKLWLLKTRHVLGPEWELKGRTEEEWQHAVLLPVRCAVLSLLDVYLKHWGFDFNNSIAGGSVGTENESLRAEAAGALRNFLVDVADCGSLSLWGWNNDTIYNNPETDCPGLFMQFPALSGAICAAVASDKKAKSENHKLKLTMQQLNQLRRTLKRNPTFIGRMSNNSDDDNFAFDSFQSNSAKASALAINEKAIVCLAKQATCVIAAEHKLSTEAFENCTEPEKKLLRNAVDKIILATAMIEVSRNNSSSSLGTDSQNSSTRSLNSSDDHSSDSSNCYGNSLQLPKGGRPQSAKVEELRQNSVGSTSTVESDFSHLTTVSAPQPTTAARLQPVTSGEGEKFEISGPIMVGKGPHIKVANVMNLGGDQRPVSTSSQSSAASALSSTISSIRVASTKLRRTSLLMNMIGAVQKQNSIKSPGFRLFSPLQVAQQVTLHLHYLYCTIPLREFTLDLSFKHSKESLDMYGQPHLARLRNESERLPNVFISSILEIATPNGRGKLIGFLVEVCQNLYEMRSFHAMMLILSALQSNPVHRLKKSWAVAYQMSYQRRVSGVEGDWDGVGEGEGGDLETVTIKDGYSDLLLMAGIGGRNLAHVAHAVMCKMTANNTSNPNDHRIAFPDKPSHACMMFLNASLGTLIRLNELPDLEKFEVEGVEATKVFQKTSKGGRSRSRGASMSKKKEAQERESLKILNLSKMRRCAAIFAMLRMSQLTPYEFEPSPNVQYFIQKNMAFMEGEEQYQQSLLIEPRESRGF